MTDREDERRDEDWEGAAEASDDGSRNAFADEQSVVISDELWEAAQSKAEANGQTISDVIRQSLRQYVAENS